MNEETLFAAALAKQEPDERQAYLDRVCGDDAALRRHLEELLRLHTQACSRRRKDMGAEPNSADAQTSLLAFLAPSRELDSLGRLDHYEVLAVIGSGGMGAVFKARDTALERVVAIKLLLPQLAVSGTARKRFVREARAAAAVRDEHVVSIHAVQEAGPVPYLVMEYIDGITLEDRIKRHGPVGLKDVLRIGAQLAQGLAAAHQHGLIHRDIKPANILLESVGDSLRESHPLAERVGYNQGRVKITDFGLARAVDDASLTQSGIIAGTPLFMSPEQAEGQRVDQRSDLFSLGSVLYVMCTGRPPFRDSSTAAVLRRVIQDTPRPIREIIPDVPEWLCAIIAKLHAKKPGERFGSAREVAELLLHCQRELAEGASIPALALLLPPAALSSSGATQPANRGKRRRCGLAVAAATLLGACLLIWLFLPASLRRPAGGGKPAGDPGAVVFRVEANRPWQDTGVDVVEGEAVVLSPRGTWGKGLLTCSAGGLPGAPRDRAVLPDTPLLRLLARVGDQPEPTPVPGRLVFRPRRGGRLFVQANDLDLPDNNDSLQLTISGGQPAAPGPAPEPLLVQAADRDWKPLLDRIEAPGAKPDEVRDLVFAYCCRYPGTTPAFRAGQRLVQTPSLVNSIGMELRPIPPGTFLMGSSDSEAGRQPIEGPQHEVVLTQPFYLGARHVTVQQFRVFVEALGYKTDAEKGQGAHRYGRNVPWKSDPQASWRNPGFPQSDADPVVCISWYDACSFCSWLSAREGREYSLPTEAQWEYAARAGNWTKYHFGNNDVDLDRFAWFAGNAEERTHPVGQKEPNRWGLYDMGGNAFQWCLDEMRAYTPARVADPRGSQPSGDRGMLRGGSWVYGHSSCRAAHRSPCNPVHRDNSMGFRVVLR